MPDLFLDDVDDDLIRRLEERAARNGRSLEEEHRAILENAMHGAAKGSDLVTALMAGSGYFEDDELPVRDPRPAEPADCS